jgi:hypothetical protein
LTWTPTNAASDIRPIVTNLLNYFAANQTAALKWANGNQDGLADFTIYPNAEMLLASELKTVPHFGIIRRFFTSENANSGLIIDYQLVWQFEVMATYTEATRSATLLALQSEIDCRAYALESMFLNCPTLTLFANVVGARHGYRNVSRYDPLEMSITEGQAFFNVQQTANLKFTENP